MNAADSFITLLLFLIFRYSLCTENAGNREFENLAQNYAKWMQKSWTPDTFAFHELISPRPTTSSENEKYVIDSVQYDSGFYDFLPKNFTSQCTRDLFYIITNLKSEWALKMLDSDGKLSSGLLQGNTKWPGDYTECKNTYAPPKSNDSMGNFHGRYCTSTWVLNLGNQSLQLLSLSIGVCVPDTCDGQEILSDIQNIMFLLERLPVLNKLSGTVALLGMSCEPLETKLDGPAIGMICFLSILGVLIVVGSSVTIFEYFFPSAKKDVPSSGKHLCIQNHTEDTASVINSVTATGETAFTEDKRNVIDNIQIAMDGPEQESSVSIIASYVKPFIKSFCIFTNGAKILNTDVAEGQLLCVHGIRFLSMAWVILGHTYVFALSNGIANLFKMAADINTWEFQVILQGTLSVDTFFLLSGFLLTYLFLKEADKKDGKISWPLFYFHRFWRLTPVYLVTLGFDAAVTKYLSSGPFWPEDGPDPMCKKTWWRNLLYINNFGEASDQVCSNGFKQMEVFVVGHEAILPTSLHHGVASVFCKCMGWAWYLANDMQFYIISPIFLYPLWRWPKVGLSIVSTLLLSSWITTGIISTRYNMLAVFGWSGTSTNTLQIMSQLFDYFWKIYVKPYARIGPYLIGVFAGYILYKTGNKKKFLEPWSQLLGWSIATAFPLWVIFGVYDTNLNTSTAAAYNTLSRSAFALSLAWIIYACQTGHGDIVNKILSWKMFVPLSRLTYCAYLVHPILITGFYQSLLQPLYFSHIFMVVLFFGFLVMSYIFALMTSLAMESPMMGMEKLLLKKR